MQYEELKDQIKDAMKAHDKNRLNILRQVHGELKNIEVNERREIVESDVTAMIKRCIKQTGETLEGSIKAANDDERTERLREQVEVLKGLLPKQIEGAELSAMIEKVIAEIGATSKKDMGRIMGELNKLTDGNFDKRAASQEVSKKLS